MAMNTSGMLPIACSMNKTRFELSGMRWTQPGAENLLRLRAVAENGDWDDYHQFRKQQRHDRLYNLPFPARDSLEDQALDIPVQLSDKILPFDTGAKRASHHQGLDQQRQAA